MLFNSFEFLFAFLPLAVAVFFLVARASRLSAAGWLAAASLFFYGWWDPRYLILLAASIAFNFACGTALARRPGPGASRVLLAAAVAANLITLGVFKYADFFIDSINRAAGMSMPLTGIVLPLGISFYTFTQIAFLVDASRGEAREYRFLHYLLFVTWFPHLIAGPILHHRQLVPQFDRPDVYRWSSRHVATGLALFTMGLAKKVLLADTVAAYTDPGFQAAAGGVVPAFTDAWVSALAYTFQLYFDFSGYSDMAVGLSMLFGIRLPENFRSPYKAANISEFWRRWHITLSQFLRDYLYVPLGGNRRGEARRYLNLFVTMLLGGLWHGANWTFVVWGGFHGALLAAHHGWQARRGGRSVRAPGTPAGRALGTAATFLAVVVGWVLFRAVSLPAAGRMLEAMAGFGDAGAVPAREPLQWLALCALIAFCLPNSNEVIDHLERFSTASGWRGAVARAAAGPIGGVALGGLFMVCVARLTMVSSEFLYFQF
jgi:alginate O-acetyltransferase complex protein AlgI